MNKSTKPTDKPKGVFTENVHVLCVCPCVRVWCVWKRESACVSVCVRASQYVCLCAVCVYVCVWGGGGGGRVHVCMCVCLRAGERAPGFVPRVWCLIKL